MQNAKLPRFRGSSIDKILQPEDAYKDQGIALRQP
jgi:hypothetical protein